jgi:hypothetical protein
LAGKPDRGLDFALVIGVQLQDRYAANGSADRFSREDLFAEAFSCALAEASLIVVWRDRAVVEHVRIELWGSSGDAYAVAFAVGLDDPPVLRLGRQVGDAGEGLEQRDADKPKSEGSGARAERFQERSPKAPCHGTVTSTPVLGI